MSLKIENSEIHVWEIYLDYNSDKVDKYIDILSDEEKNKAFSFRFSDVRGRYIISHAALRLLLSEYLGKSFAEISFYTNKKGKPYIKSNHGIYFNLSHSHKISVVAISKEQEIGIDIEYLLRKINLKDIARRFFTIKENEKLDALPENLKKEAFFRCWTRKEAYLKAKGFGISVSLKSVEVSLLPEEKPEILAIDGLPMEQRNWSLFDIIHIHNYIGAIAAKGRYKNIKYFNFFDYVA